MKQHGAECADFESVTRHFPFEQRAPLLRACDLVPSDLLLLGVGSAAAARQLYDSLDLVSDPKLLLWMVEQYGRDRVKQYFCNTPGDAVVFAGSAHTFLLGAGLQHLLTLCSNRPRHATAVCEEYIRMHMMSESNNPFASVDAHTLVQSGVDLSTVNQFQLSWWSEIDVKGLTPRERTQLGVPLSKTMALLRIV